MKWALGSPLESKKEGRMSTKILIIDDEAPIRDVLSASLKDEGHDVILAPDGETGLKAIKEHSPEIVFLDIWMPGKYDGIEVLTMAKKTFPRLTIGWDAKC